jgi:hypothetical protein
MKMEIVSDHGFPKGDGDLSTDDPFDRFKNERDYVAQSGHMKTTAAAMDWAASEIERLRKFVVDMQEVALIATDTRYSSEAVGMAFRSRLRLTTPTP